MVYFSRTIECDKLKGTICKDPEGILTIFVQMIRSFVWDLRGRWKKTFQKLAVFTMTKDLAYLSSYYRTSETSGNNL